MVRARPRAVRLDADRLKVMSSRAKRKIFQSWEAPYELTSVQAGEVEAVHKITTEHVYRQQLVSVEGPEPTS